MRLRGSSQGEKGPGTSGLLPHFCGRGPGGRSGPPEDTAEGVSRQRVLGISEGQAGSRPGEEQGRSPRCLEGSSGRGGRGAGGARPTASFSHGMPLPRFSGPGGQAWGRSVARAPAPPQGKVAPAPPPASPARRKRTPDAPAGSLECTTPCLGTKLPAGGRAAGTLGTAGRRVAAKPEAPRPLPRLPAPGLCPPRETGNERDRVFLSFQRLAFLELTPSWVCYFYPP